MELLIVYYALSSGRQNYTSCYCQLCSPHLSVFIFPFRTPKSTQRCSLQHKLDVPLRQQGYRMFRVRIILCLDLLLICIHSGAKKKKKRCLFSKVTLPICLGQVLTYGKTEESSSKGSMAHRRRTSTK